jgi:hypothetical protein
MRESLTGHQDYFAKAHYFVGFIILTQSCDLQRTPPRRPRASDVSRSIVQRMPVDFINLAVIRRFDEAFGPRYLSSLEERNKDQSKLKDALKPLLAHQPNRRGFFFIPQNKRLGIHEAWVADLRVLLTLHRHHYDAMLGARICSLADPFPSQLGQVATYLFNRIALPEIDAGISLDKAINSIATKHKQRFAEAGGTSGTCEFQRCKNAPTTIRWVPVVNGQGQVDPEELLVCKEHAQRLDLNRVRKSDTLRARGA